MSFFHIMQGLLVAAVWGFNFVAIKVGCQAFQPLSLIALRLFFTTFPLIFFLPLPKTPWRQIIGISAFMWLGQFIPMFMAIHQGMAPGLSSILLQVHVVITTILSVVFFGVRLNAMNISGLLLATSGLFCIASQMGGDGMVTGYLLIMSSAFSVSIGNFLMKTREDENLLSVICWSTLLSFPVMACLAVMMEDVTCLWKNIWDIDLVTSCSIFYTSYFSSLGGFFIWGFLMRHYPPSSVVPFTLMTPVFGMASCAFVFGEKFAWGTIFSSILVLVGLVVNYLGRRKNEVITHDNTACEIRKAA